MSPSSAKPSKQSWLNRVRAVFSLLLGIGIWLITWVLPVTFIVLMAWGCETHARQLGRRALVFYDGALYHGWTELGHMVIVVDGEPCIGACSGRGHVEAYCSGSAADRIAARELGPGQTAHELVAQGHPALAGIGHYLGCAIGSLVNVFNPETVVIGGGFGLAASEYLLPPARLAILREALAPGGQTVRLALAELGSAAGMIGAGLVAFEAL